MAIIITEQRRKKTTYLLKESWRECGVPTQRHIASLGSTESGAIKKLASLVKDGTITQEDFDRLSERFNTDIWGTPQWVLEKVRTVFGGPIELDPCTQPENPCGALRFFTKDDDGLKQEWNVSNLYCNPPYSAPKPWLDKIAALYQSGQIGAAIALVKDGVMQNKGTVEAVRSATLRAPLLGRLKFEPLRFGRASNSPNFDVLFLCWGQNPELFKSQFEEHCSMIF